LGYRGFWRGNFINSFRVFPSRGILFATNDTIKAKLSCLTPTIGHGLVSATSGMIAGGVSTVVTYPLDLVRTRIAGLHKEKKGFWKVAHLVLQEDGILGFYRGMSITLINTLPYSAIAFCVYDFCNRSDLLKEWFGEKHNLFDGAMAGIVTGTATFPLDTLRRLVQTSGSEGMEKYKSPLIAAKHLYTEGGFLRFFRGAGINCFRIAPQQALVFTAYERLKIWFD